MSDPQNRAPNERERIALMKLSKAWHALRAEGWQDPFCLIKDETFEVIELGSTGIHIATHFPGDKPGQAWVLDSGDAWPSRPLMIRRKG